MTDLVPLAGDDIDTVPQLIVGHLVPRDGECPDCGRSRVQHAQYSCGELDRIRAWVAYGKLPRRRWVWTRSPR